VSTTGSRSGRAQSPLPQPQPPVSMCRIARTVSIALPAYIVGLTPSTPPLAHSPPRCMPLTPPRRRLRRELVERQRQEWDGSRRSSPSHQVQCHGGIHVRPEAQEAHRVVRDATALDTHTAILSKSLQNSVLHPRLGLCFAGASLRLTSRQHRVHALYGNNIYVRNTFIDATTVPGGGFPFNTYVLCPGYHVLQNPMGVRAVSLS
jgi:hypothetical protein